VLGCARVGGCGWEHKGTQKDKREEGEPSAVKLKDIEAKENAKA